MPVDHIFLGVPGDATTVSSVCGAMLKTALVAASAVALFDAPPNQLSGPRAG